MWSVQPLPTISATGNHVSIGNRPRNHCLLQQPIKKQSPGPGGSPVESKLELVQVVVQLARLDCVVMSSHHPALKQGSHPVDSWHGLVCRNVGAQMNRNFVVKPKFFDLSVSARPVAMHSRPRFDRYP